MGLGCLLLSAAAVYGGQIQPSVASPSNNESRILTRSIEGIVQNKDKQPIGGAIVLLKNTKTLQVRSYIAQTNGRYHFFGLSTDINYQVRAESAGLTSKIKMVSVFDSHKVVKLDLKVYKEIKR